jgi:hypothetical protein
MIDEKYDSFVSFEFHTDLISEEYKQFIYSIIEKFLCSTDLVTDRSWLKQISLNNHRWNEEGYIDAFYIEGELFSGCKLYLCDETDMYWKRTIVFRGHYSKLNVERVFLISDAFEKFLIENDIDFSRHNRLK